jgi:ABC-type cobalamin/Fe3+-siderophores transport system ATPase subunit
VQYIQRRLTTVLLDAARHFPAVVVTGPCRAGKTTLLRKLFPKAQYVLLEDPDVQRALQKRAGRLIVVHRKSHLQVRTSAIAKGVEALDLGRFVGELLSAR